LALERAGRGRVQVRRRGRSALRSSADQDLEPELRDTNPPEAGPLRSGRTNCWDTGS